MESLYGKRTAAFLRGTYIKESRERYSIWESKYKQKLENMDREIKITEESMFCNSFDYLKAFLNSNFDVSLITLKSLQRLGRIGFDNIGNRHLNSYMLNYVEISNTIIRQVVYWIAIIDPYLGPKYEQQHIELIRLLLDKLLSLFKNPVTKADLESSAKHIDDRVSRMMQGKLSKIIRLVDGHYQGMVYSQLAELKVASMFKAYYSHIGNEEKSFMLMSKAYLQCKSALSKYVSLFAVYRRLRHILGSYFDEIEDEGDFSKRYSLNEWKHIFIDRKRREIYVYAYLRDLEKVLPMTQVINIVKILGDTAIKLNKHKEAVDYLKTLVVLHEIYFKLSIIQDQKSKGHENRENRLIKQLELNQTILDVHNKLSASSYHCSAYQKAFMYIVCAIFIYNNSLRMIDQSDPLKYPKKNPNVVLTSMFKVGAKSIYSKYIQSFNESYKTTLVNYEMVWKFVEHNPTKFKQEFFVTVKDSMDYLHQDLSYTKRDFTQYISYALHGTQAPPIPVVKQLSVMDSYQENFIGRIENLDIDEFVDAKVQTVVHFILTQKNRIKDSPLWVAGALGSNLEEYNKGKLNKAKIKLYFEFVSMDIDLMTEIMATMIYRSHLFYMNKIDSNSCKRPPYQLGLWTRKGSVMSKNSNGGSKHSIDRIKLISQHTFQIDAQAQMINPQNNTLPMSASRLEPSRSNKQRPSLFGNRKKHDRKPDQKQVPLTIQMQSKEPAEDFFKRIYNDISEHTSKRMNLAFTEFKRKYFKYAKRKKQQSDDDTKTGEKANVEGNKQRQRIMREDNNPDFKIGIFLRQLGSVDTYRPASKNSRFYRQKLLQVQQTKQDYHLAEYRYHNARHEQKPIGCKTHRHIESQPADLLNILHRSKDYYSDLQVRWKMNKIETKRLNTKNEVKEMSIKSSQSNRTDTSKVNLKNIESSIFDINRMKCHFIAEYGENYTVTFNVSQNQIAFTFTFRQTYFKISRSTYYLVLPQELWILKEKMMLRANPELIKTYLPVIFDILLKEYFCKSFDSVANMHSITNKDSERVEDLKRLMGLKYPIEITRLASYDYEYMRTLSAFSEASKTDFDNLQALLLILNYFASVIGSAYIQSPTGKHTIRYINMAAIAKDNNDIIKLTNALFIINYKLKLIAYETDKYEKNRYLYRDMLQIRKLDTSPELSRKPVSMQRVTPASIKKIESSSKPINRKFAPQSIFTFSEATNLVPFQFIMAFLERLYARCKITTQLKAVHHSQFNSHASLGHPDISDRSQNQSNIFNFHANRQLYLDEYGAVNYIDVGIEVDIVQLKTYIERMPDLYSRLLMCLRSKKKAQTLEKLGNLKSSGKTKDESTPEMKALLLLLFFVLNNSVTFKIDIDSAFRQKYEKGYSRQDKPQVEQEFKKSGLKKLILDVSAPKIGHLNSEGISIALFYMILDKANSRMSCDSLSSSSQDSMTSLFFSAAAEKVDISSTPTSKIRHPIFTDLSIRSHYIAKVLTAVSDLDINSHPIKEFSSQVLKVIKKTSHLLLLKDKSFYEILVLGNEYAVHIHNIYKFKYPDQTVMVEYLADALKLMIVSSADGYKMNKMLHTEFLVFYELIVRKRSIKPWDSGTETDDKLKPMNGFTGKKDIEMMGKKATGLDSNTAEITANFKDSVREIHQMFDKTFIETMQHVTKTGGV